MTNQRRTVLRNDFNKETFIFTTTDDPEVARFDVILGKGGGGGGNALLHIHPLAEERFVVACGRLKVVVEGREALIGPGEDAIVPNGKAHYFVNGWDGDTTFTVEFRPAQKHLLFFANFARMTMERPDWFSAKGDPDFLLIAATLHKFKGHLYLARPPAFVQKLLFAILAPVARLCGYAVEAAPIHMVGRTDDRILASQRDVKF
jgi:mannose-6-phosphate isomerase-like protein (cupin superfamily)